MYIYIYTYITLHYITLPYIHLYTHTFIHIILDCNSSPQRFQASNLSIYGGICSSFVWTSIFSIVRNDFEQLNLECGPLSLPILAANTVENPTGPNFTTANTCRSPVSCCIFNELVRHSWRSWFTNCNVNN